MSLVLPVSHWPAPDRAMWVALQKQAGPLDDRGALSHLRTTSLRSLELRYGRWLCWLAQTDPAALALFPAERATLSRLTAWLADLAHTSPMTRLMFVDAVLRILHAYAPEADWSGQRKLRAALKRAAGRGDRNRKLGRVLSSKVLLDAGLSHANTGAEAATTDLQAMIRRRDGLMIAMLALMPMRRRAFVGLRLGESVHVTEEEILIALPEELTKTGRPWEAAVPGQVAPLLRQYLTEVRPWFMARGNQRHDFLWVSKKGRRYEMDYLGGRIASLTQLLTGVRVPPHFFRDAAATTLARISPESARLIPPVLAHSGFGTAERHYIHAQTIEAGRDYAALIHRLKRNK